MSFDLTARLFLLLFWAGGGLFVALRLGLIH
jgi:hypothetical protein